MNPWSAIGDLVLGLWKSHKFEKWVRAWMSIILSALITFLFTWGSVGASLYHSVGSVGALTLGFFAALVATAGAILNMVRRVEQFKNIALFFPAQADKPISETTEYDPNQQGDKK
jgi:hypothetical protein